jgi:hypothetical protein
MGGEGSVHLQLHLGYQISFPRGEVRASVLQVRTRERSPHSLGLTSSLEFQLEASSDARFRAARPPLNDRPFPFLASPSVSRVRTAYGMETVLLYVGPVNSPSPYIVYKNKTRSIRPTRRSPQFHACITARAEMRRFSSGIGSSRRLKAGQLCRAGPIAT